MGKIDCSHLPEHKGQFPGVCQETIHCLPAPGIQAFVYSGGDEAFAIQRMRVLPIAPHKIDAGAYGYAALGHGFSDLRFLPLLPGDSRNVGLQH